MAAKPTRRMLGNLCMLLAPLGALKLASWWMAPGAHLASANGNYQNTQTVSPVAAPAVLSPQEFEQRARAASYAISMQAQGFGPTPFYYSPQASTPTAPAVTPTVPGAPQFTVQVIMSSESETKALVNGKVYRIGDEFQDGWIIADIDGIQRTVTIADPRTSRSVTQAVRLPREH